MIFYSTADIFSLLQKVFFKHALNFFNLFSQLQHFFINIISITITSSLYCLSLKLDRTYIIPVMKKSFVFGNQFDFYNFIKDKSIFNNATVKQL